MSFGMALFWACVIFVIGGVALQFLGVPFVIGGLITLICYAVVYLMFG